MKPIIRMPFGKHKGTPLIDLPDAYVDWLLQQDWVNDNLRSSIAFRNHLADMHSEHPAEPIQTYSASPKPSIKSRRESGRRYSL